MKTLCEYLGERDYAQFLKFTQSSRVHNIDPDDEANFYINAPKRWAEALICAVAPSVRAEKAIIRYQNRQVLELTNRLWRIYPQNIRWTFSEGIENDAEKVISVLKEKPDQDAEALLVKRGNLELFKIFLDKFGSLEEDTEKLLHEDAGLTCLLSFYVNRELSC